MELKNLIRQGPVYSKPTQELRELVLLPLRFDFGRFLWDDLFVVGGSGVQLNLAESSHDSPNFQKLTKESYLSIEA
jgi:hypothetical protein